MNPFTYILVAIILGAAILALLLIGGDNYTERHLND